MGIPGTVTLLKERANLSQSGFLEPNSKLIIDCTESMYWFLKEKILKQRRMDKYGCNFVEIGQFFIDFFSILKEFNVNPIVVFSGARGRHDCPMGEYVSKTKHYEKSARVRLYVWNRRGLKDEILPPTTIDLIKQIICQLNRKTPGQIETIQAPYEVYPVLEKLATMHKCPVMTSHTDFIMSESPDGFILAPNFPSFQEIRNNRRIHIYQFFNQRYLLISFGLQANGSALKTLYALMRPDFSGIHYRELNKLFEVPNHYAFPQDDTTFVQGRPPNRNFRALPRLYHILSHWKSVWTSPGQVRRAMVLQTNSESTFVNNFDSLFRTFNYSKPISEEDSQNPLEKYPNSVKRLIEEATTTRYASFELFSDILMNHKIINRLCLEDRDPTVRSSFSLGDRPRCYIMKKFDVELLDVLDRTGERFEWRKLNPGLNLGAQVTNMFQVFLFPPTLSNKDEIKAFNCRLKLALNGDYYQQLLVWLLLARYGFKQAGPDKYNTFRCHYYDAMLNSFFYYAYKDLSSNSDEKILNESSLDNDSRLIDDPNNNGLYPNIRLAVKMIDGNKLGEIDISHQYYVEIKQMNEWLNHSVHHWLQLYSLEPNQSVDLHIYRYFDGILIFKIMKYLLTSRRTGEDELMHLSRESQSLLNVLTS